MKAGSDLEFNFLVLLDEIELQSIGCYGLASPFSPCILKLDTLGFLTLTVDFLQAQKLLENILETTLEVVEHSSAIPCDDSEASEGGIRLFKNAPVGVVFDHVG